jgi:ATP-dependent 26S proteasome regulatory subunit
MIEASGAPGLSPAQRSAWEWLRGARSCGSVFVLSGHGGCGRTTLAALLAREFDAAFLRSGDLIEAMKDAHPLRLEEEWTRLILEPLRSRKAVVVDDFDATAFALGHCHTYPRTGWFETGLRRLCDEARERDAWLLFVGGSSETLGSLALHCQIPRFTVKDQEHLFGAAFGSDAVRDVQFEKIFRYAPRLTARQIFRAARFLPKEGLTTERILEYLRTCDLVTNVDLGEVEAVDLRDLHGVDDVLERLESNIILPLENDELSKRLNLTPRRGVLLYGPPGTGKTTVGRALAHRLKSKFFLIDGTFISGTSDFYNGVVRVFEHAKRNAPAVVFVDDSDVIFEAGEEMGFYRYLLTILDGVESEEAGKLTVMLTAMDLAHLPPALIRSGRVEVWLEMKLPEAAARRRILEQRIARSVPERADFGIDRLVESTDGFTGADLRRLVEDGKNLWGYALAQGRPQTPADCFSEAAAEISRNKKLLADAEARASAHFGSRRASHPGWAARMEYYVQKAREDA